MAGKVQRKTWGTYGDQPLNITRELSRISKINGTIRRVSVGVKSNGKILSEDPAVYGVAHDHGNVRNVTADYTWSDAGGNMPDFLNDPYIQKSIDRLTSGETTRRPSEELDELSERMAYMMVWAVCDFIEEGAHHNYQDHKMSSNENLIEDGDLLDSIVGVVEKKDGTVIHIGR